MNSRTVGLMTLMLAIPAVRAADIAWVWLTMPPGVAEEIEQSAEAQARADIANGTMMIKISGSCCFDEDPNYERLLGKYHLTYDRLGCSEDERKAIASRAYNTVISAELERQYGKGFWNRFNAEFAAARQSARNLRETTEPNKLVQPIAPKDGAPADQ